MHIYKEIKIGKQSRFEKHILDGNGESICLSTARIPLHAIERSGMVEYLIYDDDMQVISSAFEFLNTKLVDKSPNTRKKAAYAIRLLHCFLALAEINIENMNDMHVSELRQFLRGIGMPATAYAPLTTRSNNTVNEYLSIYRTYLAMMDVTCEALTRSRTVQGSDGIIQQRYSSNLSAKKYCENRTPKYVSPEEVSRLLNAMEKADDHMAAIIIRLMYGYGMRIGEVLGLTLEDVVEIRSNDTYAPALFLQNRLSDRVFQHAKGLRHPVSSAEYRTRSYEEARQIIVLDYAMYDELIEFIEKTHAKALHDYPCNYEKTIADIVSSESEHDVNHYVFLNRYGRVLSGQTWGSILKEHFRQAGILPGDGTRGDNLSHRFRHGFAMFFAHFSQRPVGVLTLQKMMRHKRLSSTLVYYNPTIEDEIKVKSAFQEALYEAIPELKAWPYVLSE